MNSSIVSTWEYVMGGKKREREWRWKFSERSERVENVTETHSPNKLAIFDQSSNKSLSLPSRIKKLWNTGSSLLFWLSNGHAHPITASLSRLHWEFSMMLCACHHTRHRRAPQIGHCLLTKHIHSLWSNKSLIKTLFSSLKSKSSVNIRERRERLNRFSFPPLRVYGVSECATHLSEGIKYRKVESRCHLWKRLHCVRFGVCWSDNWS